MALNRMIAQGQLDEQMTRLGLRVGGLEAGLTAATTNILGKLTGSLALSEMAKVGAKGTAETFGGSSGLPETTGQGTDIGQTFQQQSGSQFFNSSQPTSNLFNTSQPNSQFFGSGSTWPPARGGGSSGGLGNLTGAPASSVGAGVAAGIGA